jgi:hypothetical protein
VPGFILQNSFKPTLIKADYESSFTTATPPNDNDENKKQRYKYRSYFIGQRDYYEQLLLTANESPLADGRNLFMDADPMGVGELLIYFNALTIACVQVSGQAGARANTRSTRRGRCKHQLHL